MRQFLFALPCLLAASLASPLAAQSDTTSERVANGQRFGAWTVTCEAIAVGETACVLSQRLVRSSDNAFLAELLAFRAADGKQTYLSARVPNGVYFPSGFAIKPDASDTSEDTAEDDGRYDFSWQACTRDLCEALLELDEAKLSALSAEGTTVIGGYRPSLGVEPVIFRFDMSGVTPGLEALGTADQ
ncbi:MAG: invasion associated locus B family protein [Pelagimonas sp.]|jgi:invasion protein IalB|nr:invasion associated locus B family protein [Pelagimonas sp.]